MSTLTSLPKMQNSVGKKTLFLKQWHSLMVLKVFENLPKKVSFYYCLSIWRPFDFCCRFQTLCSLIGPMRAANFDTSSWASKTHFFLCSNCYEFTSATLRLANLDKRRSLIKYYLSMPSYRCNVDLPNRQDILILSEVRKKSSTSINKTIFQF